MAVELEVAGQPEVSLPGTGIFVQVHLLVLHRAPQTFGEDVVQRPVPAIHADPDAGREQPVNVLRTGEMAALIAVPDLRLGLSGGPPAMYGAIASLPSDDKYLGLIGAKFEEYPLCRSFLRTAWHDKAEMHERLCE